MNLLRTASDMKHNCHVYAATQTPATYQERPHLNFPCQSEFQSYTSNLESVSNLISPCSGISGSGTLSPFPDHNYGPINPHFLEFRNVDHSKNLNLEKLYSRWESQQGSGSLTPDPMTFRSLGDHVADHQSYVLVPDTTVYNGWTNDETALDLNFFLRLYELMRD
ncbi:hypothetical protein Leryth_015433, partial [Lithospermum erythrorhizon]